MSRSYPPGNIGRPSIQKVSGSMVYSIQGTTSSEGSRSTIADQGRMVYEHSHVTRIWPGRRTRKIEGVYARTEPDHAG
jgi:hypothetical protein